MAGDEAKESWIQTSTPAFSSPSSVVGSLAGLLDQELVQTGIAGWFGAVRSYLIFAASMIITLLLPSYFVFPGTVQNAVFSLPKRFGSPKDAERVDSTEKVVI